jgi:hypothetical protein
MKVAVRFTLEVDPDWYRDEYSAALTSEEIRQQVRSDAIEAARQFFSKFDYAKLLDEWDR